MKDSIIQTQVSCSLHCLSLSKLHILNGKKIVKFFSSQQHKQCEIQSRDLKIDNTYLKKKSYDRLKPLRKY